MRFFITSLTLFTLFLGVFCAPLPDGTELDLGDGAPPADQVYVKSLTYGGTGCPPDTVRGGYTSLGMNTLSLIFDNYVASIGPGIKISESRKNCLLQVNLKYPPGWILALYSTTYRGFLQLDPRVEATQRSDYWFPTHSGSAGFYTTWTAGNKGYSEDYSFTDTIKDNKYVWSRCGSEATLNINTQIRLNNSKNPKGSGLITTDAIDHKVVHDYVAVWRRCKS